MVAHLFSVAPGLNRSAEGCRFEPCHVRCIRKLFALKICILLRILDKTRDYPALQKETYSESILCESTASELSNEHTAISI
jgi:hypothetical protein